MTFADSVRFLYSLGHELKVVKWDLDRMRVLLCALGDPHKRSRFVHVAGTNGKGSVCAMIESSLRAAGLRTGLYTSPHLVDPRERITIAGRRISEDAWLAAFIAVRAAAERLIADEVIDTHPSFFETMTAMAFVAFADAGVDMVVLETGLGGRLDATNVVDPELSVITPIDFDHEAFLGNGIEQIAGEKAGILKQGRPAVFSAQRSEADKVLTERAAQLGISVSRSGEWIVENLNLQRFGSSFTLRGSSTLQIECPLAGAHQVENAGTASAALSILGVPTGAIERGIAETKWPGRLERVRRNPDLILDGAHNPAGAKALAAYLLEFFRGEPIRLIFGAMRDKAIEEVTNTLFPLASEIIVTAPHQPRALSPAAIVEMAESSTGAGILTADDLTSALRLAAESDRTRPMATFVTGSLFLVGEARGQQSTQS